VTASFEFNGKMPEFKAINQTTIFI